MWGKSFWKTVSKEPGAQRGGKSYTGYSCRRAIISRVKSRWAEMKLFGEDYEAMEPFIEVLDPWVRVIEAKEAIAKTGPKVEYPD